MSRQASPISGKPYGLAAVCRVWRLARSGIYRQRTPVPAPALHRRGPFGPMPDASLLEAIRTVLAASPFHGEGHRKIWAEEVQGSDEPQARWKDLRRGGCVWPEPAHRSAGFCG
jgi:hypothetical protein